MHIKTELIQDCIAQSRVAQKQLYSILLPYLNSICMRYLQNDSERKDVLQETFINIFKSLNQYDCGRATFKTWATKICINNCLHNNKKRQKNQTLELVFESTEPSVNPEILNQLSNEDLLVFLKKMPAAYLDVFNLYIVDGFDHKAIGAMLKIDASLSRQRLTRARNWIKNNMPVGFDKPFDFHAN